MIGLYSITLLHYNKKKKKCNVKLMNHTNSFVERMACKKTGHAHIVDIIYSASTVQVNNIKNLKIDIKKNELSKEILVLKQFVILSGSF